MNNNVLIPTNKIFTFISRKVTSSQALAICRWWLFKGYCGRCRVIPHNLPEGTLWTISDCKKDLFWILKERNTISFLYFRHHDELLLHWLDSTFDTNGGKVMMHYFIKSRSVCKDFLGGPQALQKECSTMPCP